MPSFRPDGWPEVMAPGAPASLPPQLAGALATRGAKVDRHWSEHARTYGFAGGDGQRLFFRFSSDPGDAPAIGHEARVRGLVGDEGPLRTPPALASGRGWLLEPAIDRQPVAGPQAVDAVAAAACRLMEVDLPDAPARSPVRESRRARLTRALRLAASAIPARDVLRSRRILATASLPPRQSHGDLHPGNLLVCGASAWLVDWELSGQRPAGFDLMRLWPLLERSADRERLFEAAVAYLGEAHRPPLERLRYALFVRTVGGLFAAEADFNRQPERARRLLALLPELRR